MAFVLNTACTLLSAWALAACAGGEDRPLPPPLVGPGLDGAVTCGELRDAALHGAFEPDAARLGCAADGLECKVELDGGLASERCSANEVFVAECFAHGWLLRCAPAPNLPDAS